MNIQNLREKIDKFSLEREWDQFHSIKNLSMALSVESSELLEIFQWMTEEESNSIASQSEKFNLIEDEVADVFIYLLRLTGKLNINIEKAVEKKMEKNALKYPVELSKGNSTKYNKL
jgi:NTP pyrophosphatase (non-canonical NTP hydrolase)